MRVLIVDDHPDTVDCTELLLAFDGHDVETAKDGVQGIERAAVFRPDLVLLDLGMPVLDGLAVARRIQGLALPPRPYLVAVTGYARLEDKRRCAEAGFDLHISKPVDADTFQGLTELLRLSSAAWSPLRIAKASRWAVTELIVRQLEMANLALDATALAVNREAVSRCIAKAEEARDRVTIWLNRQACTEDRVEDLVKALSALRQRVYSCRQQPLIRQLSDG
jgi:CheY-like chemotaxis protein